MLEEGIAELTGPTHASSSSSSEFDSLKQANEHLKSQLDDALRKQREARAKVLSLEEERFQRAEDEAVKRARKKRRRIREMEGEERRRKEVMGEVVDVGGKGKEDGDGDGDVGMEEDGEGLSSDTDEFSSD